jgi:hypothetical protein
MWKLHGLLLSVLLISGMAAGQTSNCGLQDYKPIEGLNAQIVGGALQFNWQGEKGNELRAQFTIRDGQPEVLELAARKSGGQWVALGKDLVPEFKITAGERRMSVAQANILKSLKIEVTPQLYDQEKWMTFWDAPLVVPGVPGRGDSAPLPRSPDEIHRDTASYKSTSCEVSTDGGRLSVTFDGLHMGIFSGQVKFTAYKGSNLLRQEAIAKTDVPGVAYIYQGGLKGFAIGNSAKVVWRDTAHAWQQYAFGGAPNKDPVNVRARNRLMILDAGAGSLAVFPPPHKFFFARENEVNLGYVYYRKDSESSFALGVMQPEVGEGYHPWGVTDAEWKRREGTSESEWDNFELYNAPPGTMQHMAVYYYLSSEGDRTTQQAVMAYTHDDVFKPVPGFKVLTGHFHLDLNEMLRDRNSLDYQPPWVSVFRGLGVNIVYLGDFHDDSHPTDPGPVRFMEEKWYFEGSKRLSDKDFLVMPEEEPNAYLGGHWYLMTPKPVYFSHAMPRPANQSFIENDPQYGQVYHLGSAADVLEMVNRERGIIWTAHPRTKNSEDYPDAYKDQPFFLSDRFIGASWESLPVDLSEKRLCEIRCFSTNDDMSNWAPSPKYMIAEGDTYTKWPDDETYPQLTVNYLKLGRVPAYNESWSPIVEGIRTGNFFGTTGEILFHNWAIEGSGPHRTYTANIEYTFPLEFAELVWSDGAKVDRKIIKLTDTLPFGTKQFKIPFDATGKKWVRFAVWDSAGDGAYTQPISLTPATTPGATN